MRVSAQQLRRIVSSAVAAILVASCTASTGVQQFEMAASTNVPRASASDDAAKQAAIALNAFAFDLYGKLDRGNLVYSPASVGLALAMARPGAKGRTAAEMDAVLRSLGSPDRLVQINSLARALDALNVADPQDANRSVVLRVANAQFAQRGYAFQAAYLDALASAFGAGAHLVDYADPEAARKTINGWVAQQTEQRIKELIAAGMLDPMSRLTLVNAIYMKAAWAEPFDSKSTTPLPFTTADGAVVQVPTTAQLKEEASYAEGSGWRAVELPYAGGSLAMTVIVPDDLAAFEQTLDAAAWDGIVSQLKPAAVTLRLPKFKLETRARLESQLASLGMHDAFDPDRADFSGITTEEPLYISFVIHQANIDVGEAGTEASAATAVGIRAGAVLKPLSLDVNRPFLFAVRDRHTGAVVFLGRVADPSKG